MPQIMGAPPIHRRLSLKEDLHFWRGPLDGQIRTQLTDIVSSPTTPGLVRPGRTDQSEMGGDEVTGKDFDQPIEKPVRTKLKRITKIVTVVRILQGTYYAVYVLHVLHILG